MRVSVVVLGKLGLCTSTCFANELSSIEESKLISFIDTLLSDGYSALGQA